MKALATRAAGMPPNLIADIGKRGKELQRQGVDVIFLNQGQPDFPTPPHIIEAAFTAMQKGFTTYVPNEGIPELRAAVAEKVSRDTKNHYNPEDVIITNGGALAIFLTNMALVDRGVEVVTFEPYFGSYANSITAAQGKLVTVPMVIKDGRFQIELELLEAAITPQTKMLILNSPCNPTGSVLSLKELEAIAALATKYDLWVLSDEVYDCITFDGKEHISIASLSPEMAERTIILNSFSKTYSMTGWRLGYVVAKNRGLLKAMSSIYQVSARCATSFVQYAGLEALTGPQDSVKNMTVEYEKRRDFTVERLNAIRGFYCPKPEGTFYAFVDISHYNMDSVTFCQRLVDEAHVAVPPGRFFGQTADNFFRISFAASEQMLEEGLARIKKTVASW